MLQFCLKTTHIYHTCLSSYLPEVIGQQNLLRVTFLFFFCGIFLRRFYTNFHFLYIIFFVTLSFCIIQNNISNWCDVKLESPIFCLYWFPFLSLADSICFCCDR
ncbi:Uncharacterized protein TCM_037761 [Theobroma cacao]|uniref:Uncharacterized protein n=1 Tax=Theobroma cacao TaxID=3641 RepID=A0A061GM53_THECC|nr:Uncharacterized protein TCM_037761 [Theobroma cacao]